MVTMGLLVTLAVSLPDAGVLDCGGARCAAYRTPRAAFEAVLAEAPVMLAVGEVHEVQGALKVKSALKHFSDELVPALKGRATSLIAETWILNGKCGETEKQATAAVQKATRRPESTEDELTTMLGRAFDAGLKNHLLVISCDDYRSMLDADGELEPDKSLRLVRAKIEDKARDVRFDEEGGVPGKLLVLYGGALHNDLRPAEGWEPYSFGPSLARVTDGGYVELDLLVPEYVEKDEDFVKQAWFAPALKRARAGQVMLVNPTPGSWVLLFAFTGQKSKH